MVEFGEKKEGGKGKKGKKKEEKEGREERGMDGVYWSNKEEKYVYFVSLFNIGPYDRQKNQKKTEKKEFLKLSMGGKIFQGGPNI